MHSNTSRVGSGRQVAPPCTNRGVQNAEGGISERIHWFEATLKGDDVDAWLALLPDGQDWTELPKGMMGYSRCRVSGPFRILYAGTPSMGTHLIVAGAGCDRLHDWLDGDWSTWMKGALAMGCKVSRLDLARDQFGGALDLEDLSRRLDGHAVTSRWTTLDEISRRRIGSPARRGHTLRLGAPSSDATCNIYDKRMERAHALPPGPDRDALLSSPSHVRVELRLRRKRACAAARAVASSGFSFLAGLIRSYIDFKVDDTRLHSTAARVPSLPAWSAFLEASHRFILPVERVVSTLPRLLSVLSRQYGPTLAAMGVAWGGLEVIDNLARASRCRLREKHLLLVDAERLRMAS